MPQLHETGYGRRLFEYEIPELNRNLSKISEMSEHLELFSNYLARIADALEKISEKQQPIEISTGLSSEDIIKDNLKNNIALLSSFKLKDIFSIRVSNALLPKHNLYELVKSTEKELLATKNFGLKCLWEVNEFLSKKGLQLEMDDSLIEKLWLYREKTSAQKLPILTKFVISHD